MAPISYTSVNLREEYANAFRTESYTEFWSRVLDLTLAHGSGLKPNYKPASTRLPSYRLLAENLLDPDQPTVTKILTRSRTHPGTHTLLTGFFSETANAFLLCGLLLKDIDHIRTRYRPLKSAIQSNNPKPVTQLLTDLNPFTSLTSAQFNAVQAGSASLLSRLESSRKKTRAKLRVITRVKHGLAVLFVALVASTTLFGAFIAVHGLIALVAVPGLVLNPGRLVRRLAQVDSAAKGMYILNRDLDTISWLVERLRDEVEHIAGLVRFWEEKGRVMDEVGREIAKNGASFDQKLDELEEHLYLCFLTINKARGIVVKEVSVAS